MMARSGVAIDGIIKFLAVGAAGALALTGERFVAPHPPSLAVQAAGLSASLNETL
jgi:hypothetical protein